jgi:glucan biosynthesis protein C
MDQKIDTQENRLMFLDNLRSLMVVLVLIFHAGASYSSAVDFWPFHESDTSQFIDIFLFLSDVFMMSILFFIAGYFALPSLMKRGTGRFLENKLKVLGIPWLTITVFVLPILDYIHYRAQVITGEIMNFGTYWFLSMKRIAQFHVGWLDMSTYIGMPEQFYQRYMWFLSLLLLFFIIFAVLHKLNERYGFIRLKAEIPVRSNIIAFARVALLTILLFAVVKLFIYSDVLDSGWFSLGSLVQFQVGKLTIYAVYFGFGVYAYSRKWFVEKFDIGPAWIWVLFCFSLFGVNMLVFKGLTESPSVGLKIAHVILYPLWTLSFLGLFLAFAFKYWNRVTPLNKSLSANSYNMYLVHYIFPMTLPLLLSNLTAIPITVKFGIVSVSTVIFSYLISRFVLKPFPKLTATGVVVLPVILAAVV